MNELTKQTYNTHHDKNLFNEPEGDLKVLDHPVIGDDRDLEAMYNLPAAVKPEIRFERSSNKEKEGIKTRLRRFGHNILGLIYKSRNEMPTLPGPELSAVERRAADGSTSITSQVLETGIIGDYDPIHGPETIPNPHSHSVLEGKSIGDDPRTPTPESFADEVRNTGKIK